MSGQTSNLIVNSTKSYLDHLQAIVKSFEATKQYLIYQGES